MNVLNRMSPSFHCMCFPARRTSKCKIAESTGLHYGKRQPTHYGGDGEFFHVRASALLRTFARDHGQERSPADTRCVMRYACEANFETRS
jgi:hypothetical protein